jgi:beta-lactamase class A
MDPKQPGRPYYNYYTNQRPLKPTMNVPKKPHKHRLRRIVIALIVIVLVVFVVDHFLPKTKSSLNRVVSKTITHRAAPKPTPSNLISNAKLSAMGNTINNIISQNNGIDISVNLIDLNTKQTEHYGTNEAFTAASTTKVITAAYFLHEVEAGKQSLSESINGSPAQYELQQMIVVSDDNAWDALNSTLGYSQLQAYANSIGLSSFQSVANTVTSADMASIMDKLYEGDLLNPSNTQLLLSYLKQANYREYIVPAVPSNDIIYHKIGLYEDNVNDEAVITSGSKAFVIVIFTNGNGAYDWPERAAIMQQITKPVLSAFF